ncbi:UDP-glucose 4-epimerase GalE (plasmid) [Acuticoccus sp. MNP-M23]|uniref:UDP-glucose 4-epimerase GalE n=1 Tax=Acuticoccus sp. MNP-M23 TaxID=3072793 RepID=UPI002815D031|nr:UDP-glucose 4-epimerase GalE [Acuticoccus sp. MNP-M23]WMS45353.1 UDP-glucose 4-epimerase GalE [Acuticoccus sp. MNP-M23]
MKVLITGGAGYIGSHAAKALAAAGHEGVVYDNLSTGHLWAVKWGPFEYGDIGDTTTLAGVMRRHGIEAVLHFAARSYVGESAVRPDIYYRNNVSGSISVLDAMRAADVGKIVFSSTCSTYGARNAMPLVEGMPQAPINCYGRTKLMVEEILGDYASAYGIAPMVLRFFNAAGADPDGELGEEHVPETHLVPLILQAAAGMRPEIQLFGDDYPTTDGTCVRDYVHVTDLGATHLAALSRLVPGELQAYNLGSGTGYSVREMLAAAERITGRPVPVQIAPRRPGDPPRLVADTAAAAAALGWSPRHSDLDTIIATTWAWMTEHRQNAYRALANRGGA